MSPQRETLRRRTSVRLAGATAAAVTATLALAAPAGAAVPEGWSNPDDVHPLMAALVIVGGPLLLALLIAAAVYLPAIMRGEQVGQGNRSVENQWLGGPRRSPAELAGPDDETSQAGGASARW